jgi:acyl-CoA dehydrogenase
VSGGGDTGGLAGRAGETPAVDVAAAAHDLDLVAPLLHPRHRELAAAAAAFARDRIATLAAAEDDGAARLQAREILELLGEAGFVRLALPPEHGGAEGTPDLRACCLVREALAAASPLADAVFALQALGSMPITLAGGESLRARWLPEIGAGRAMAAFAMTEAAAGSDVGAIRTMARREGERYLLDGRKLFISNAGIADLYVVFASTDPTAGRRGLAAFVVAADKPGLRFVAAQVLSEPHPLGELAFDSCAVGADDRLGEDGDGFRLGMETLDRLRPTVAAAACGMASRALAEAAAWARERHQFGRALVELQLVQAKLATMASELAAARLLVYRAAFELDHSAADGGRGTLRSSIAKLYATEAAQRIVDQAVQIVGGRAVLAAHPLDRLYRAVRALRIYEGTSEIQQLVIARELLRGPER